MKNLLLLNGPPRCGKDTAGEILAGQLGGTVWTEKVSAILKERTHALYGITDRLGAPMPHDRYEADKDKPRDEFFGLTPRQAYVAVSERHLKPLHGEDVLGRILAGDLRLALADPHQPPPSAVIVTDSGFLAETRPIAALAEHVLVVRIHREGCTFGVDSRSYWPVPVEWDCIEVVNPGEMGGFRRVLEPVVEWAGRAQ